MSVREQLLAIWAGRSKVGKGEGDAGGGLELSRRRTLSVPSILSPYGFGAGQGLPKPTQANLRKFAETPVVRRAINVIKDRIVAMDWQVRLRRGAEGAGDAGERKAALRRALEEPNACDSFRTLLEQVIEDALTGGYGAIEMEATGDPELPVKLWPVDGATIRVNANWDGGPETARYRQVMPGQALSKPTMRSRRRLKTSAFLGMKSCGPFSASTAAAWLMEAVWVTDCDWIMLMALINGSAPAA